MPERDCAHCERQVEWGCESAPSPPIMFSLEDGWLERCPMRPYYEDPAWYNEVLETYAWMKRGFLSAAGTWRDQGAKASFLTGVIDKALADAQDILDARAKAQPKDPTPARGRPSVPPRRR